MKNKMNIVSMMLFVFIVNPLSAMSPDEVEHTRIRNEFLNLQSQFGLQTNPNPRMFVRNIVGAQGTQQQFNTVRAQLNTLLGKLTLLTSDEINQAQNLIQQLRTLNPARWPQPEDYQALLASKLSASTTASAASAAAAAAAATSATTATSAASMSTGASTTRTVPVHGAIQDQFIALSAQYGTIISPSKKATIRRIRGRQTIDQAGFNRIRFELYTLLSKPTLTPDDVTQIRAKIAELRIANPARWPQPEDYEALLSKRVQK